MPKIRTVTVHNHLIEGVYCDLTQFSDEIAERSNELEASGYEVISIMPVTQGHWATKSAIGAYGYSTTQGVIITGRLRS